jgi:hypothetical protein
MIEITNKNKFPVQIVVRSKNKLRSLGTLNIPGTGAGKNIYLLEDERHTEYIDRVEAMGLISTRKISRHSFKGE